MKFQIGDHIKVIRDSGFGATAYIKGKSWNSIHQEEEYVVKWDHDPRECTYKPSEVDHLWELDKNRFVNFDPATIMPWPQNQGQINHLLDSRFSPSYEESKCSKGHDWKTYDSGFTRFEYCSVCNQERR